MTISKQVKEKVLSFDRGSLFASRDFLNIGNRDVIDKTLSRMVILL